MFKTARWAAVAALTFTACTAFAQSTQPGLWSIESKMGGNPELEQAMAQMQQQLASMPPAQRKQMEAMMGKSGMSMATGGGMTVKVCITPEMASRQQLPTQTEGDCTTNIVSSSPKVMKLNFSCKNPASSGEGTYTFDSDKAYTMNMLINTAQSGKMQRMTMNAKGRWLSADCGDIKPIALPKGQ